MTEQQSLEWDARDVMEQIQMAESRHMQMGALCSYLLEYPDMTIRDFFTMAAEEIREEQEEEGYYE
tara:strand:- start:29 stop:226 length:198 start_codon:yes stop_codon:yes gene_type:complete